MEMIAPLARVLADANGIEWQQIQGTGDGGMVVEQDILNYLARVMSGEEEPPDTPVDLPPPDWTGEMPPMPNMDALSALSQAGVESDITDFVAANAGAPAASGGLPSVPGTESKAGFEHDAMDFELDDDATNDAAHADDVLTDDVQPAAAEAMPAAPAFGPSHAPPAEPQIEPLHAEELHVERPVEQPHVEQPTELHAEQPQAGALVAGAADIAAAGVAGAAAATGGRGLGGLLSRLYNKNKDHKDDHKDDVQPAAEAPAPSLGEPVEPPSPPVADTPVAAPLVADQLREDAPERPAAAHAAPHEVVAEPPAAAFQAEPQVEEQHFAAPAMPAAPMPEVPMPEAPLPEVAAPVSAPTPAPAASGPVAHQSLAARRGVHLRVTVDTAALEGASSQLGEHFGRALPMGALLARAAARSLRTLGLGSVGIAQLGDDVTALHAPNLHGDLRAALDDLHAGHTGDWSELMVVDAAALGLDELHLTQDIATLSLGHSQDGHAALTLTGAVSPAAGAAFLNEVAGQLQTPIKLLF